MTKDQLLDLVHLTTLKWVHAEIDTDDAMNEIANAVKRTFYPREARDEEK